MRPAQVCGRLVTLPVDKSVMDRGGSQLDHSTAVIPNTIMVYSRYWVIVGYQHTTVEYLNINLHVYIGVSERYSYINIQGICTVWYST